MRMLIYTSEILTGRMYHDKMREDHPVNCSLKACRESPAADLWQQAMLPFID